MKKGKKWSFIVHPRDQNDIKVAFGNAFIISLIKKFLPKFKVLSEEYIFGSDGQILVIPIMPDEMYKVPHKMQKLVLETVLGAWNSGSKVVGLGELTSCFTNGGNWLLKQRDFSNLLITTGNNLTAGVVFKEAKILLEKKRSQGINPLIAVVGATGSVGSAVSKLLSAEGYKLLLIARNKTKLSDLKCKDAVMSVNIEDAYAAEIILLLTSSKDVIINADSIHRDTIIYDITQPSNFDDTRRSDLQYIQGGLVTNFSEDLRVNAKLRLPVGKIYSCLAETALLSNDNLGLASEQLTGNAEPDIALSLLNLAERFGIYPPLSLLGNKNIPELNELVSIVQTA